MVYGKVTFDPETRRVAAPRDALQIADYAYVLQTGRIALHGPANSLRHNPQIQDAYLGGAQAA